MSDDDRRRAEAWYKTTTNCQCSYCVAHEHTEFLAGLAAGRADTADRLMAESFVQQNPDVIANLCRRHPWHDGRGEVVSDNKFTLMIPVKVALPSVPNFLRTEETPSKEFDVDLISEADLRAIGAAWTEALVANAKQRRESK